MRRTLTDDHIAIITVKTGVIIDQFSLDLKTAIPSHKNKKQAKALVLPINPQQQKTDEES